MYVRYPYDNYFWRVEVPEKGLTDVTFRPGTLTRFSPGFDNYDSSYTIGWWLPDDGDPIRVPLNGSVYNLPTGAGWLWGVDGTRGRGSYTRSTNNEVRNRDSITGPSVGIYFPLEPEACLPGAIKLTGLDDRAGLVAEFSTPAWFPCPTLNAVLGQLDAVPPGNYTLTVETSRGLLETPITVTEDGCAVKLQYPPKQ